MENKIRHSRDALEALVSGCADCRERENIVIGSGFFLHFTVIFDDVCERYWHDWKRDEILFFPTGTKSVRFGAQS